MSIYKEYFKQVSSKKAAKLVDNTKVQLTARDKQVLSVVWQLNDHEKALLDRYFLLIRPRQELALSYCEDRNLPAMPLVIYNGGVAYEVIFQGASYKEILEAPYWKASFRYQEHSKFAVVIIKEARYTVTSAEDAI